MTIAPADPTTLKRVLGLPLLVFYGVGVTVGAGIFALIGQILGIAGDLTPLVFLFAAILAGASAGSYALLSARFPKAAGAAVYAEAAFGAVAARITGIGVVLTGIISSAVIALAFGSYVATLVPVPPWVLAVLLVGVLAVVACIGVRVSVLVATVVTIVEVGTLIVIAVAGIPELAEPGLAARLLTFPSGMAGIGIALSATTIAFYAFIGFEDIVNMAEETKRPERAMKWAVIITLAVTTVIYLVIAAIAVAVGDRAPIASSGAPMADIFAELTGLSPAPLAGIAAAAMINGVLIQILMASRVLFGMSRDGLIRPAWLAHLNRRRSTPVPATILVALLIGALVALVPIVSLAEVTSYVTLAVFTMVNFSLWRLMRRSTEPSRTWKAVWGLVAGCLTVGLVVAEIARRVGLLGLGAS